MKLSKIQLSEILQSGGFLVKLFGPTDLGDFSTH